MASTSAIVDPPTDGQFEEEVEEEAEWMEAHQLRNNKKNKTAYDGRQSEHETSDEYHDVDVEEYDDAPIKNNLPDLLSKRLDCENGSVMTVCFSKKGISQLATDGYLYTLTHSDGPISTYKCVNPQCSATILSINEMTSFDKGNDVHVRNCDPDEAQLQIRISIYDLRLVTEFTDTGIDVLYESFSNQFGKDFPLHADLYPSLDAVLESLLIHRRRKTLRRHFDAQIGLKLIEISDEDINDSDYDEDNDEGMLLGLTREEELVMEVYEPKVKRNKEELKQINPYGRTRGFPPTYCMECGTECEAMPPFYSSQHALVDHVNIHHHKIMINSFLFELAAFEYWLREVQRCPILRFRRFSLIGEDMFYLCGCDLRLPRSKFTKRCHCTAYIKISDYRRVANRQVKLVTVEYTFQHFFHEVVIPEGLKSPEQILADLRPEDFLYELDCRKQATADMVRSRIEMDTRRQAIANSLNHGANRYNSWTSIRNAEDVFSRRAAMTRSLAVTAKSAAVPPVRGPTRQLGSNPVHLSATVTRRANFKDPSVYESVRQFEQLSHIVIQRLQNVKDASVVDQYTDIMKRMVNRIVTDADCTPEGSPQAIWSGVKSGVNPGSKRGKKERKEEEEGEEESDRKRTKKGEEEEESEEEGENDEDEDEEDNFEERNEELEKGTTAEEEKKGMRTRGRSQLPVKSTRIASAARVDEEERERPQYRRRTNSQLVKENAEKSTPGIVVRSKSTRIQARKKIDG